MFKILATNVVVSKGYENTAALKYSENGDSVRFRIGNRVYDTRAENNTRWVNITVKAFGQVCDRIKKMQLKEGSYINISGRFDEDTWADQQTGATRSAPVIILDDIEFAGAKYKDNQKSDSTPSTPAPAAPAPQAAPSGGFTGYEPFGGGSFFDEN